MAQIASSETNKSTNTAKPASDPTAESGKRTTVNTADVMRETADQAENIARSSLQTMRQAVDTAAETERKTVSRAGEGLAEFGQALMEAINEQARDNIQLARALSQPTNWGQATKLQREFLQASFQRTAEFTRRYVEIGQTVMTSVLSITRGQAKKAT